ncbi:hypothetical protein L7F22_055857 [Adiantum nelumboides]|nr:hypothetical protein [Adiantum nelumboides]
MGSGPSLLGAESTSQVEDTSLDHLPDNDENVQNRGRDEGPSKGSNPRSDEAPATSKQVSSEQHRKLFEEKESICAELVWEKQMNRSLRSQMEKQEQKLHSLLRSVRVEDMYSLARNYYELQQYREQATYLRAEIVEYEKKCVELSYKVDQLERLHSQKAMANSGSYHDSAATPPLLQTAVDGVNDAICVCASDFFSSLKRKANFDLYLAQLGIPSAQRSPSTLKAALQALLCKGLFKGFGDSFFSLEGTPNTLFSTPSDKKSDLFLSFKRCRDKEAEQLLEENKDFAHYVDVKAHDLCAAGDEIHLNLPNWTNDKVSYRKYLRLAKAVWVLHKLALAFEPSAEMFHVGSRSAFNGMFMEDIAHDEDEESDRIMQVKPHKQVKCMCVPGFTVRRTVIKSRVFCLPEYMQHVMEKSDPSAMIVEDQHLE